MIPDLVFHHVGLACARIEAEIPPYLGLGFSLEGPAFSEPLQRIRGQFLVHGGGHRIELLEPAAEDSPLRAYLARGISMYHQAFLTQDLDASISALRNDGALLIAPAVPSVAFAGRRICFLLLRNRMMVELVEA
jgi:methylmalonyl-CoA/ethylmalonyl-CoA epimerase